jgi:hypothetical protein
MVEFKFTIHKDNSKRDTLVIKDGTDYTLVSRNDYNLFVFADRFTQGLYQAKDREEIFPNGSSKTLTEWEFKNFKDGYYKILIVAAPDHVPALSYLKDKVVFGTAYEEPGLFLSVDENVPANTLLTDSYFWQRIESIDEYPMLANSGSDRFLIDHLHDSISRLCLGDLGIAYAKEKECAGGIAKKKYLEALMFHHASIYAGSFGDFEESGKFLDLVIDRCDGSADEKGGYEC